MDAMAHVTLTLLYSSSGLFCGHQKDLSVKHMCTHGADCIASACQPSWHYIWRAGIKLQVFIVYGY